MITLVASTMWMYQYGGMMNDYEGSEVCVCVCRVWAACYLSHPSQGTSSNAAICPLRMKQRIRTWHSKQSAHEHLCRAFFMQRRLPQLPRHTSRPTETNGVSREYECGMMHTPEFCHRSSGWAHAAGSRHVVSAARCSYEQLVPAQACTGRHWLCRHIAGAGHVDSQGRNML